MTVYNTSCVPTLGYLGCFAARVQAHHVFFCYNPTLGKVRWLHGVSLSRCLFRSMVVEGANPAVSCRGCGPTYSLILW